MLYIAAFLFGSALSAVGWYILAGRHFDRVIKDLLKEQKDLQASNRRYNGMINMKQIEVNRLKAKLAPFEDARKHRDARGKYAKAA